MKYPSVNYIGNKEKIVNWIISLIPKDASSILDVFAGGCSVSYAAKLAGMTVYTNDILKINYLIGKALIENNNVALSQQDIEIIFSGTPYPGGFMDNYCSEKYYFREECRELDLYRNNIENLDCDYKKALALILLRRAMIRKMPYSRFTINWDKIQQLRDEDYSYAHYGRKRAYHNQTFKFHFEDNLDDYNLAVFANGRINKAFNLDVYDAIDAINADVIYLDPPYAGTMNDYFGFYGLLDAYIDGQPTKPFENNFILRTVLSLQTVSDILHERIRLFRLILPRFLWSLLLAQVFQLSDAHPFPDRLLGQRDHLLFAVQRKQCSGMTVAELAFIDHLLDLIRKIQKSKHVRDVGPGLAYPFRQFVLGIVQLSDQLIIGAGLFDRCQILSLNVLQQRDLHHLLVVEIDDDGRNRLLTGQF